MWRDENQIFSSGFVIMSYDFVQQSNNSITSDDKMSNHMKKGLEPLRFFTAMPDEERQWFYISNKRRKAIAKGLRGLLGRRQRLGSGVLQGRSGSKARRRRS